MNRAYLQLTVKAMNDTAEERVITGMATTPEEDRMGDIVDPMGCSYAKSIPLLMGHDANQVVGSVELGQATAKGIPFTARIPSIKDAGRLKERCDEAWHAVKAELIRAVSIGFRILEDGAELMKSGGIKWTKTELLELSLVAVPANAGAQISGFKAFVAARDQDRIQRSAALGRPGADRNSPGASGTPQSQSQGKVMNLQEQLAAFRAKHATLVEKRDELLAKSVESGETFADAEASEFDSVVAEVKSLGAHITRLESVEADAISKAVPAPKTPTIHLKRSDPEDKFKGQSYTRMVIAKALAWQSQGEFTPSQIAEQRWGKTNPQLVAVMKAAVAGGGSGSGEWGAELVTADNRFTGDFIEFLNQMTVFDKLGLRSVPANVTIKGQDGAATGYWVGESKAIPVTKPDFSSVTLSPLKVAALAVVSNELIRDSSPAAEMLVRDALVAAAAQRIDATFMSTTAASAGVSPAGLLVGVTGTAASGTDAESLRADIAVLYAGFISAYNASGLVFVMPTSLAKSVQLMRNAFGQREFEGISQLGGTLEGDPVVTGDNVPAGNMILLKPSDIYKIGDGGIQVSMSNEATIEMDTTPTGASDTPAAATLNMVNMYQTESTAIKIVRSMNFAKRRASAVDRITGAAYSPVTAGP